MLVHFRVEGGREGNLPHTASEPHFTYLRRPHRASEPPPNSLPGRIWPFIIVSFFLKRDNLIKRGSRYLTYSFESLNLVTSELNLPFLSLSQFPFFLLFSFPFRPYPLPIPSPFHGLYLLLFPFPTPIMAVTPLFLLILLPFS